MPRRAGLVRTALVSRLRNELVTDDAITHAIRCTWSVRCREQPSRATIARVANPGNRKVLLEFVRILPVDSTARTRLPVIAVHAAQTKAELPDIVNVMLEALVRHRYELPPVTTPTRIASHARSQFHESIYPARIPSERGGLVPHFRFVTLARH